MAFTTIIVEFSFWYRQVMALTQPVGVSWQGNRSNRRSRGPATPRRVAPSRCYSNKARFYCATPATPTKTSITSVAVALGIGWFIGRMGGHSDYWDR